MSRVLSAVLVVCLVGVGACSTADIYGVSNKPFGVTVPAPDGQVAQVIIDAGERKGWVVKPIEPGKMRAIFSKRRHVAVVAITYSDTNFSISYLDSMNLNYDGDSIHESYNVWVKDLESAIQREAMFRLK